jgi:hypothetical protein
MQAYSPDTDTTYPSRDALIDAEANGFAVVIIMQRVHPNTDRITTFVRMTGPFTNRDSARTKAASLRRQRKRIEHMPEGISRLKVAVEPLWSDFRIGIDQD